MRKTQFISPRVKTYETDKSDKKSVYANTNPRGGAAPSGAETPGSAVIFNNFLLLENGFFLLQENNGKFIIS